MKKAKLTNKQAIIGIALSAISLTLLALAMETKTQAKWQEEQLAAAIVAVQEASKLPSKTIDVDLIAKSAIVYDIKDDKVLYNKNADAQLPLASITKLFTALLADIELGSLSNVEVSPIALETEGNNGLVAGDRWRERDLSDFMLAMSSNDASSVLAGASGNKEQFIAKMNQLVRRIGLKRTVIFNESGLDLNEYKAGSYGSARDISKLFGYIVSSRSDMLEATTYERFMSTSVSGVSYEVVNTNKIIAHIPGLIGSKTGFTDIAGGNLAIVFDAGIGRPIAVVVLGSTVDGRFEDVLKLVNSVIE